MSRYRDLSDSQANAEALARRSSPYSVPHAISVSTAYDYRRREPRDLREAEHMVRRAHADEVPTKLHDGRNGGTPMLAADGSPRFAARAEGYIFGNPEADDAGRDPETGQRDLTGDIYTPFRSALSQMEHSDREAHRKHAAIVTHVTFGQRTGVEAAIAEGVPSWCAGSVAELALKAFLNQMSTFRIHPPIKVAENVTAA